MSSSVVIYIDLKGLAPAFANNISASIAGKVAVFAHQKVAVSTEATRPGPIHGTLRNTIQSIKINNTGKYIVVAQTEYAWAQERGLAKFGKPNYTYTPYMGPAAKKVTDPAILNPLVKDAMKGAIEKQRRRAQK